MPLSYDREIFLEYLGSEWPKYRRLISKSAFMQFWAILTFLHIWKNESQGYLKKHGPW